MTEIIIDENTMNVPKLTGEPSDCFFGIIYRMNFLAWQQDFINKKAEQYKNQNLMDIFSEKTRVWYARMSDVLGHNDAKFWVDNRRNIHLIMDQINEIFDNEPAQRLRGQKG